MSFTNKTETCLTFTTWVVESKPLVMEKDHRGEHSFPEFAATLSGGEQHLGRAQLFIFRSFYFNSSKPFPCAIDCHHSLQKKKKKECLFGVIIFIEPLLNAWTVSDLFNDSGMWSCNYPIAETRTPRISGGANCPNPCECLRFNSTPCFGLQSVALNYLIVS